MPTPSLRPSNAPDWTRTSICPFVGGLLYPLSYRGELVVNVTYIDVMSTHVFKDNLPSFHVLAGYYQ
jgi:hypothetical protein